VVRGAPLLEPISGALVAWFFLGSGIVIGSRGRSRASLAGGRPSATMYRRPIRRPPGREGTGELPPVGSDHACLLDHVIPDRVEQHSAGQPRAGADLGVERVEPEAVVVRSVALGRQGAAVAFVA
jgi:hypothetical protein